MLCEQFRQHAVGAHAMACDTLGVSDISSAIRIAANMRTGA